MANPSFVQGAKNIAANTTVSAAYGSVNSLGNLLICVVQCGNTGVANIAVTDTQGNVWQKLDTETINAQSTSQFWYVQQCKAGANTVTGHDTTGNSTVTTLLIGEYQAGTAGMYLALDAHAVTQNFVSTPASPNCTTNFANDLLIGWTGNNTGTAITAGLIGGGAALLQEEQSNVLGYEDNNAAGNTAGSNSATFGGSQNNWSCGIVAFKLLQIVSSISGSAGVAGATVAYAGPSSGSVVANGSGNYTIPSLANGSYTITPSLTGYTFSPTSATEVLSGTNITGVNFTATATTDPDNPAIPFLGSVSVSGKSAAIGAPYLGHYNVLGSVPARASANPYLGNVTVVASAPAGASDILLGEVVIVSGPPAGFQGADTPLGQVRET